MIIRLIYRLILQRLQYREGEITESGNTEPGKPHRVDYSSNPASIKTRSLKAAIIIGLCGLILFLFGWYYSRSLSNFLTNSVFSKFVPDALNSQSNDRARATLHVELKQSNHWPVIVYLQGNDLPAISHDANENTNPSIRSHNGEFHPQFQVVRPGSSLQITNKDPIAHNTHVFYRGDTVLNVGLPLRDKVVTKVLPGTGVFSVRCDLHPTMQAWIFAPPSKFYAVVNEPQVVKFNNIPPGQHILHFWRNDNSENYRLVDLAPGEMKLLNQR